MTARSHPSAKWGGEFSSTRSPGFIELFTMQSRLAHRIRKRQSGSTGSSVASGSIHERGDTGAGSASRQPPRSSHPGSASLRIRQPGRRSENSACSVAFGGRIRWVCSEPETEVDTLMGARSVVADHALAAASPDARGTAAAVAPSLGGDPGAYRNWFPACASISAPLDPLPIDRRSLLKLIARTRPDVLFVRYQRNMDSFSD